MSLLDEMDASPTPAGVSPSESSSDFEKIRKSIFGSKNKTPKIKKSGTPVEETEVLGKEIEKLFAGENFKEVAALYFNARFAITGWDGFLLSENQKKVLGMSLSTSMRLLVKIDPGYLALLVFTTNFGGIIAQKEMSFKTILNEDKRLHPEKYGKAS